MAYFRCLAKRSSLLTRRCHPSAGHILHPDEDRRHDSIAIAPSLQGITSFVQQRGFRSGFANLSPLGSLKDGRCVDFLRHMPTSSGGRKEIVELVTEAAEAAQAPAVNEVAIAAADSTGFVALVQQRIDDVHGFSGLNWWACIVLTTLYVRLATLPVLITDQHAISHVRPHLEAIKQKMLDGRVDAYDGSKQMAKLWEEYGVSPFTPMKGLFMQVPVFICFYLAIMNMAEKVPSFRAGGASWFLDLTTPDPLFILPALTGLTFWLTVECDTPAGLILNPFAGTMKNISRFVAVATVPLTVGLPKAVFFYWITSNVFSLSYVLALKHPAVKRFLGFSEVPVIHQAPANGNTSFLSLLKQLYEASQHASRSSPPVEVTPEVSDQRTSANAAMSKRIQSLEKPEEGRKRSQKG